MRMAFGHHGDWRHIAKNQHLHLRFFERLQPAAGGAGAPA
jgi:hypothetical protein